METTISSKSNNAVTGANATVQTVFMILKLTYGIIPIVAGLDKFTNILASWENYINPGIASQLPFSAHTFMIIVGIIEIVAGALVLLRPKIGGLVVAGWLVVIAVNLIASGHNLDVAVRDIVMAVGAFSMAQLAKIAD